MKEKSSRNQNTSKKEKKNQKKLSELIKKTNEESQFKDSIKKTSDDNTSTTASQITSSSGLSDTQTNLDYEFKDLKKNMAYILTTKYNTFKKRTSILDDLTDNSHLNKSIFKGIYNLCQAMGLIIVLTYPALRFIRQGNFLNDNLIQNFTQDFFLCIITWPMFTTWAYSSYLLQKMIIWNVISLKFAKYFHYILQSFLFIYCQYMVISKEWCATHSGFVSLLACTHFMKMHSYTIINFDYREDYLESIKNKETPISNYPNNVTLKDFTIYMVMPVLVYQQEYPRNDKIRWKYLFWKCGQTAVAIIMGYIIVADYVIPYVELGDKISAFELVTRLILPLTGFSQLLFYIVWEGMCNIFAEVTRMADRQFYQDWWNSTTYEEYNRKWNKCVYNFLFRHVYLELIYRQKMSKKKAQFLTFLFSAIFHEWILCLVFKIFRPIITAFMLQQIPLFYFTRNLSKTRQGNLLVWWGLMLGIPLIGVTYLRSHPYVTQFYYRDQ